MSKVVIRQDELRFMHTLVIGRINVLDAKNKSFEGNIDKMEEHVREYRMAQDVKARLQKSIESEYPASTTDTNNNNINVTEGESNE